MDTLTYDNFFEIAKNLPAEDLLSLCLVNKQYYGFCKRPNLYRNLIRVKYNLDLANPTYADYRFIDRFKRITLTPPSPTIFGDDPDKRTYEEVVTKVRSLLDFCVKTEITAYLDHQPLLYFTLPQNTIDLDDTNEMARLSGVWFSACTLAGAIVKYKDLWIGNPNLGDFFSYVIYSYGDSALPWLNLPGRKGLSRLIRFPKPRLDQDSDQSKLIQGRDALSRVSNIFNKYYDIEVGALKSGLLRYFVINPSHFDEYLWDVNHVDEFVKVADVVIVSATPEGAILRLASLVRSLPSLIQRREINLITQLVSYPGDPNTILQNSDETYLVQIKQPRIL